MKSRRFLIILFISLILVKSLLASFVLAPSMFSDEYEYAKMARSFWNEQDFKVHEAPDKKVELPPAYSIALSPAYLFDDMRIVYLVMKIINAILSSLAIIPAYLIGKEFMSEKKSLLAAILVGIMPATFSYSGYIMSENLFVPLMLFSIWVLYKFLISKKLYFVPLLILFLVIAYLTKVLAIVLLPLIALMLVMEYWKDIKSMAIFLIIALGLGAVALNFFGLFQYASYLSLPDMPLWQMISNVLIWYVIYLGVVITATGALPSSIMSKGSVSRNESLFKKILLILTLAGIAVIVKINLNPLNSPYNVTVFEWLRGRVMGRYFDYILPLVVIAGVASLSAPLKKWWTKAIVALSLISAMLISASGLLPINNASLSLFGAMKITYEKLVSHISLLSTHYFAFATITALLILLFIRMILKSKSPTYLLATFFILTNLFNYAVTATNANTYWYNGEQMQLGLWINDNNLEGTFLIDERDEGKILKTGQDVLYEKDSATIAGFWLNNPIRIGNPEYLKCADYVISKHKLGLPLIKQTDSGIYLYQAQKD